MILETALICLSLNIFHESRGEPILGQYAVAQVTLNRAQGNQSRVCLEVYRHRQFSWTHQSVRFQNPKKVDPEAWDRAVKIARIVLTRHDLMDISRGADHYHARYVSPRWSKSLKRTTRISNHIFYAS